MPDRPDARELLDVAHAALEALIGEVDARHDYTLRMAVSALGIAARELAVRDAAEGGLAARAADLEDLSLARRVEACAADDAEGQRALYAELVAATRRKLAIANPRRADAWLPPAGGAVAASAASAASAGSAAPVRSAGSVASAMIDAKARR